MLGPFATASRLTPIYQVSLAVLSRGACASMFTTTTTTRDRGDRYGPMEWAQLLTYLLMRVGSLPYVEASILELLRYNTLVPLAFARRTMNDTRIGGYFVPGGTTVSR